MLFASVYGCSAVLALLGLSTLSLCTRPATRAFSTSSSVEVDLVFPSNQTYKPLAYFPVVFVLQEYPYVEKFDVFLRWTLYRNGEKAESDVDSILPLSKRGPKLFTGILVNGTRQLSNTTADWRLTWIFGFQHDCSDNNNNNNSSSSSSNNNNDNNGNNNGNVTSAGATEVSTWLDVASFNLTGSVDFSTSPESPVPDFQLDETCSTLGGIFGIWPSQLSSGNNATVDHPCPVIGPKLWPANPCHVRRKDTGSVVTSVMNALASCTSTGITWPVMTGPCESGATTVPTPAAASFAIFIALLIWGL